MTTFICPPQELPAEKVRQIVRDARVTEIFEEQT